MSISKFLQHQSRELSGAKLPAKEGASGSPQLTNSSYRALVQEVNGDDFLEFAFPAELTTLVPTYQVTKYLNKSLHHTLRL